MALANITSIVTDDCGHELFMDIGTCLSGFCCSAKFEANPDASGIGVIFAYSMNGVINNIGATWLWYLKHCRRKKPGVPSRFEKWLQQLCDLLAHASLFLGITVLIAAWSQFKKISHYHFYVAMLEAELATSGRVVVFLTLFLRKKKASKAHVSVALIFQALYVATLIEMIRRMSGSNWQNQPGDCFALSHHGHDNLHERNFLRAWVIVQLILWNYWHIICPLVEHQFRDVTKNFSLRVRWWFSLVGYLLLDLFLFVFHVYLLISVIVGNQDRLIGQEMKLNFGQVAALVALFTVCYAIFLGYQAYRVQRQEEKVRTTLAHAIRPPFVFEWISESKQET